MAIKGWSVEDELDLDDYLDGLTDVELQYEIDCLEELGVAKRNNKILSHDDSNYLH